MNIGLYSPAPKASVRQDDKLNVRSYIH
jgi:hypothetical protein